RTAVPVHPGKRAVRGGVGCLMRTKMSGPASELPAQFLQDLGTYLHLCSRIEDLASKSICKMNGIQEGSAEWDAEYVRLRFLGTSKLISAFSTSANTLPTDCSWKARFQDLSGWLHKFSNNRHRAVHGVFSFDGQIKLEYVDKKTQKTVSERVPPEEIRTIVFDAGRIAQMLSEYVNT
ncbi:MAG: hypothetical protein AAF280_11675, partial [Pseudomonadota bacterium]